MTEGAANCVEERPPPADRAGPAGCVEGWLGRVEVAHEEGEALDAALRTVQARVVGHRGVLAGLFPLLREELVAYALLDVVGLAGEDQQALVLGLPAKASDRPVVARAV